MTDDAINRAIEQRGETWADGVDRTQTAVLLTTDCARGAEVGEMTLPPGEGHPYWRVRKRPMTEEEWHDLGGNSHWPVGSYIKTAGGTFLRVDYYVKHGRGGVPRWAPGGTFIKGITEEA